MFQPLGQRFLIIRSALREGHDHMTWLTRLLNAVK